MAITVVKRWSKAESFTIFENPFRFLVLIVHLLGRHVMWKMTRVTDNSILVPVNRFCSRLVKELQANILGSMLKTTEKVGGHFNLRLNFGSKLHPEGGFFYNLKKFTSRSIQWGVKPKLCNQVRSLDYFVVQNSGDFLCWKYKEVVCFYISNLRQ